MAKVGVWRGGGGGGVGGFRPGLENTQIKAKFFFWSFPNLLPKPDNLFNIIYSAYIPFLYPWSHVTCHVSCVRCHVSRVLCHVLASGVAFFYFYLGTKWWSQSVEGLLSMGPTQSSLFVKTSSEPLKKG